MAAAAATKAPDGGGSDDGGNGRGGNDGAGSDGAGDNGDDGDSSDRCSALCYVSLPVCMHSPPQSKRGGRDAVKWNVDRQLAVGRQAMLVEDLTSVTSVRSGRLRRVRRLRHGEILVKGQNHLKTIQLYQKS